MVQCRRQRRAKKNPKSSRSAQIPYVNLYLVSETEITDTVFDVYIAKKMTTSRRKGEEIVLPRQATRLQSYHDHAGREPSFGGTQPSPLLQLFLHARPGYFSKCSLAARSRTVSECSRLGDFLLPLQSKLSSYAQRARFNVPEKP